MNAKALELQERTHKFFLRVIRFCETLSNNDATFSIRPQLLDSAGSTDSNYRAACRGRTHAEFTAKVGVAAGYGDSQETLALTQEADELTRVFTASQKTARERKAASVAVGRRKRG